MKKAKPKRGGDGGTAPTEITEAQWKTLGDMARDGCTHDEMAEYLGISKRTFYAQHLRERFQRVTGVAWAKTRWAVRKRQHERAIKGNPVDSIWWGKQYLGQADKQQVSQGPSVLEAVGDATERLLEVLERLAKQRQPAGGGAE